ncbi:sensor histidine kinase [Vibrio europaeus]|uniref:histidine kinase n=1 Tax=Vibrio europaeus TaxID=300876 RepID=A0ABT5GNJ6_9VIBR|nr:sensor histidine kinase VxrA [Vibrio europaeus]MDC5704916.1 sensor histidine kinase [Vibrio europaeus]MDC5710195.1 sensor histidine kinase [Vibrio europaeus]MDC5715285.1 sensor histidine kinase [Vibrio europaeus]MDC5719446.1 sensor histidine kinase [Vibrio europaeus]MDC5724666.1 sensor histidine kinase [Vibrio europaeus]
MGIAVLSGSASAESLPERIDRFVDLFDQEQATVSYDIRSLQSDYPTRLLTPESMLPQTSAYPLKDVQRLYKLAQNCTGKLPLSPLITEPLVFTRAMCKGNKLSEKWFARSALIHPGGGTYASRYVQTYPEYIEQLQQYMHIKERPLASDSTLLGRLQRMNEDTMVALISGSSMFIERNELWLRKSDNYLVYPERIWKQAVEDAGLSFSLRKESSSCFVQRGNLCWDVEDHSDILRISMVALVIANILLVLGWSAYRWNTKRQEMKSRMLILQILTHELRTPIASLSLTVEGFRREFEHLPESVYDEFRRLCEDSRRLRQLAEASKDYLQSDNKPLATDWVPSVKEWLEFKVEEEFGGKVKLNVNQDVAAKLNVYWLGTCIDNLIRNANKYGVAPVVLDVTTETQKITVKVQDQGELSAKDWRQLRKPFVSKSGLGLGLTIVESMVGRMGGKMSLIGPPTAFILEIPCETDTASC